MHAEIEDWKNGWHGVSLGFSIEEIDRMIQMLTTLRNDPEQHFHLVSDHTGAGGLGDVEIYVADSSASSNMRVGGLAQGAGELVRDMSRP